MLQYDMVVCTYIGQITAISADNLLYRQISVVSADIVAYRQIICKCRYICISVRQIICICRYAKKLYRSYSTVFQIHQYRKSLPSLSLGVNPAVSLFRPSLPFSGNDHRPRKERKESFFGTSNWGRKEKSHEKAPRAPIFRHRCERNILTHIQKGAIFGQHCASF